MAGKITELLAPAGDLHGAVGAVNAGADAVYLGTEEFSARAYAKNFSIEETIETIHYAHLYHRKIYLTMNTLLKTVEWNRAIAILERLYLEGLDAVIVQDLGLIENLHHYFPEMEIHASTQLSILSAAGMEWLKEYHITRVVPGRELSLKELKEMKHTGLELECFIHGAMCYSYSGRCLMSSLAGGRSGNRGRCAGPCRKLYHQPGQENAYLLSMKDMCSVDQIGCLIEAGIDSLKIEGRMKSAEYTAGVTSVYRRVIDRIQKGEKYPVTEEDRTALRELYIRSEVQEGYYFRHHGKEMISLSNPSYVKGSEERKRDIYDRYIKTAMRCPVKAVLLVAQNTPLKLSLKLDEYEVTAVGDIVQKAEKRAITDEELKKQICKMGNTLFEISELKIVNDGKSFAAVSQLKDLRRDAVKMLEKAVFYSGRIPASLPPKEEKSRQNEVKKGFSPVLLVGVRTTEQLRTVLKYSYPSGIILDFSMVNESILKHLSGFSGRCYLRLPQIIRQKDLGGIKEKLKKTLRSMEDLEFGGIYCSSPDALQLAEEISGSCRLAADAGIYIMNEASEEMILKHAYAYTASSELNKKELGHAIRKDARELIVYGYLPVMYSANCIINTKHGCSKDRAATEIIDEDGRVFPVLMDHNYCFNTIYNCIPLSLHQELFQLYRKCEAAAFRIEFTIENEEMTDDIMRLYQKALETDLSVNHDYLSGHDLKEYTKGHFNRGVL